MTRRHNPRECWCGIDHSLEPEEKALRGEPSRKGNEAASGSEAFPFDPDWYCPACKGKRGRWQHFEVPGAPDSWDHDEGESCECGPRFDNCLACDGTGILTGIKRATLLARGDIAPVQRRGFA